MKIREEILKNYNIENGRICNPGKYEDEPIYTPYFYDLWLDGMQTFEHEVNNVWYGEFIIEQEDIDQFPELENIKRIFIHTDQNGFVYCKQSM